MPTEKWRKANPEKMRGYRRKWYKNNTKKAKKSVKRRLNRLMQWLNDFKKGKRCKKCGMDDPICLDFHHRNPKKKIGEVRWLIRARGWCLDRIKKEIEKCDLLCANCHRKETAKKQGWYKYGSG